MRRDERVQAPADAAGVIARLPAFAELDDSDPAAIATLARVEQVPVGTPLLRESDRARTRSPCKNGSVPID